MKSAFTIQPYVYLLCIIESVLAIAQIPNITLNNGIKIPVLGLGTWQGSRGKESEVYDAVKNAIDIGYRAFDCAHVYGNEQFIGNAIKEKIEEGVVKREDLFITSKLWNTYHRPDLVEPALRTTLKNLQLDYLDLYLMHWPFAFKEGDELFPKDENGKAIPSNVDYVDTWKAMEEVYKKGLTRSIGISNFNSKQIERLLKHATIAPVTNQVEAHPFLNQIKLYRFCKERNITITAYSPLGAPYFPGRSADLDLLNDKKIKEIASKYGKTPAQILLRFGIQLGYILIPKSSNVQRLKENINIFDFELSSEDMAYIKTLDRNGRVITLDVAKDHPYYPFNEEF